jgi:AbrB family looped-hinge helix DNA binding protein
MLILPTEVRRDVTTTRVSERGQVVIPKTIRDQLGIKRGQVLEVEESEGAVVMRPKASRPAKRPRRWEDWRGVLEGTNALQELTEEHRREIDAGR